MKKVLFIFAVGASCFIALPSSLQAEESSKTEDLTSMEVESVDSAVQELETLFVLMQERLSLMHDLARYKWNHDLVGKTLDAEALEIENIETASEIIDFINAQNRAASKIQDTDFMLFQRDHVGKFENVKDYQQEILPALAEINQQVVTTIELLRSQMQSQSLPTFLKDISFNSFKNEGVDRDIYEMAVEPLFES